MTDRIIQSHPFYREGFEDALDGEPLMLFATKPYIDGWLAAHECKALLAHGTRGTVRAEHADWQARP